LADGGARAAFKAAPKWRTGAKDWTLACCAAWAMGDATFLSEFVFLKKKF
jgi:hypothetical protein